MDASVSRVCLTCAHYHPNGGINDARPECWDCANHKSLPRWRPLVDRRVVIEKDAPPVAVGNKLKTALKAPPKAPAVDLSDESPWADEVDPTGRDAHAPGAKLDAGKPRPALVLRGFADALWELVRVGSYGATKYSPNGWKEVPDAPERYEDAKLRHLFKPWLGEADDPDTNLAHLAHEAWNALALLQFELDARKKEKTA